MEQGALGERRRIVTCEDCGTPYAAVMDGDDLRLIGEGEDRCTNCGSTDFARLTL